MSGRTVTFALAALGAMGLGLAGGWLYVAGPRMNEAVADTLGRGAYTLVTTDGGTFTEDTLGEGPTAIFFGFTHCPEICPATLGDVMTWQEMLKADGQPPLRVYFVTVDPGRDTPEVLTDYVSWAPGVVGVSGSPDEIDKAIRAFRVYSQRIPLEGGDYTMDHSAFVLLFDDDGRFEQTIAYGEAPERAVAKIRRMLDR